MSNVLDPIGLGIPVHIPPGWQDAEETKRTYIAALDRLVHAELLPPYSVFGDGIVYVGGGQYWDMVVLGVRMARRHTTLPIQVWHDGIHELVKPDDLSDLQGVTYHDVRKTPYTKTFGGWQNKTTAILNSGFKRVLYLDADAYLVSNIEALFDCASISRFCFWSDLPWNDATVKWEWCGIANTADVPPIQGGQLVIDVSQFWHELLIAHWINQHSAYWYAHQYGDQDSWRIALAGTQGRYHVLGAATWEAPAFVCRYPVDALVVHRCQGKFWLVGEARFNHNLPGEDIVRSYFNQQIIGTGSAREVFGKIYRNGLWGATESSGAGSSDEEATPLIQLLEFISALGRWRSVVDLGCGDGRVTVRLPFRRKTGVDVHLSHLIRLRKESPDIAWVELDIDTDRESLPGGDVCLVKDVLHHWPSRLIREWLDWARSSCKWKWIIIVGDCHQRTDGEDCILGGYRALNPNMYPLSGTGITPVMQYLHKQVVYIRIPKSPLIVNPDGIMII